MKKIFSEYFVITSLNCIISKLYFFYHQASQCSMINLQQAEPSICKSNIELLTRRQSRLSIDMPEENIIDRLLNSIQSKLPSRAIESRSDSYDICQMNNSSNEII